MQILACPHYGRLFFLQILHLAGDASPSLLEKNDYSIEQASTACNV